jgi:uncharacterized membrane protein YdjX (TVP38/TMEM64 family)
MNKKLARNILYVVLIWNILWLIYFSYTDHNFIDIEHIRDYLQWSHLFIALIFYITLLTVRWLTLFPWTPLLVAGTLIFPKFWVIISVEIAILLYTLIIYKYSKILDFKIPDKLKKMKPKSKNFEILYIIGLCFIPGMSMNGLAYFLSVQQISLKNILIWMWIGTIMTTTLYIYAFSIAIDTAI